MIGLAIAGVIVAALVVVRRRYVVVTVVGGSMEPALCDRQKLVARRWRAGRRPLRRADIVVFVPPEFDFDSELAYRVKRVVAIAGDTTPTWLPGGGSYVPANMIVVMGDHPRSRDSRHYGFVAETAVIGVITAASSWSLRRSPGRIDRSVGSNRE